MTNEQKWQLAWEAASHLVASYRAELPTGVEVYNIGGSVGESEGSSTFRRKGTSEVQREYSLPAEITSLLQSAPLTSQVSDTMSTAEGNLIVQLLQQLATDLPALSALTEAEGIDPTNFSGLPSLTRMTERNPYSQDYESAVGALYDRMFEKGRSLAQSGPANVRGGQARTGFELGEIDAQIGQNKFRDVRQQQDREAGVVQGAVNILNTIENLRRGTRLQAQGQHTQGEHTRTGESLGASDSLARRRAAQQGNLQLAGELLGSPKQTTTDDLRGAGNQSTQSWNFGGQVGGGCCFIFLEALNGVLPEYVRRGRDEYNTPNRRRGYVWMSSWLVPLMRRYKGVASLVNTVMVKPFLKWGAWLYDGDKTGRYLKPYCWSWFLLWSLLGVSYGKFCRLFKRGLR